LPPDPRPAARTGAAQGATSLGAGGRDAAARIADILDRIRAQAPRVHCITNSVAQAFTANVLLAAGAIPSMTVAPEEVGEFVAQADAILVNLGTLDALRREAAETAIEIATDEGRPWVLDPAFIDRTAARASFARRLLARNPRAIRMNRQEFATLAGREAAPDALVRFALDTLTVVGVTGPVDLVTDGPRLAALDNGHPLMARVTALGCAGSALIAASLAVESDPWAATTAGLAALGVAGEVAAAQARGPGSFQFALIDAVDALDRDTLSARLRIV